MLSPLIIGPALKLQRGFLRLYLQALDDTLGYTGLAKVGVSAPLSLSLSFCVCVAGSDYKYVKNTTGCRRR